MVEVGGGVGVVFLGTDGAGWDGLCVTGRNSEVVRSCEVANARFSD